MKTGVLIKEGEYRLSKAGVMNGQVNELRISRGVLPPSEFMRIGASGFCMLIR